MRLAHLAVCLLLSTPALYAADDILPAYRLPRDSAEWPATREEIRRIVGRELLRSHSSGIQPSSLRWSDLPGEEGPIWKLAEILDPEGPPLLKVLLALPRNIAELKRVPAILYLHDRGTGRSDEIRKPGPTGKSPAEEFTRRGYAVLCLDQPLVDAHQPWTDPTKIAARPAWGAIVRADVFSIYAALSREEIDGRRIAAVGHGIGGSRALWLAAMDDRIADVHAIGGLTRLSDWLATRHQQPAPWVADMLKHFDTEAVAALIAPRPFTTYWGTLDPEAPQHGVETIRNTYEAAMRLTKAGPNAPRFHYRFGGTGGEFTLLEWDGMMEFLDKPFMPQVASPLPHPPEPEPALDDRFLNLAERGIAGWVPEMSQRPGTWTWDEGVIRCKPGNNEYGWLRAPIEVEDFILSLEWKVPKNGNSGVFLRSKPVFWTIPSTPDGQLLVEGRGLEWPSRTGFELQAADGAGPASKYSTGSLYRHAAPSAVPVKEANEWNRYTVRARGPRFEIWLNGEQIQDTRTDELLSLRTVPLKGYIGVQNHGNGAEFRNIRYLRLEAAP